MPDIRHAILIDAPMEKIFALVSTGSGLSQWWAQDVTEDGANVVELGFFRRATIYRLNKTHEALPTKVEWLCETGKEWTGTTLVFELSLNEGRTLVRFAHEDWASETDYFTSCNTVWGGLMFRLKAAGEGRAPGPLFTPNGMAH